MRKIKDLDDEPKRARASQGFVETKRRPMPRTFSTITHGPISAALASVTEDVKFPLCDAAIRKTEGGQWDLADAILAECSEPGEDGVRNGSQAKMDAMRAEITLNHGVELLSLERVRKLRQVASSFPPGRRRPGVSLEAHLEAGKPEALDALIKSAPKGTVLSREFIRQSKKRTEGAEQTAQKEERRRQVADQLTATRNIARQLERKTDELEGEKQEREQRYLDLCRRIGEAPEPFSPPLVPEAEPSRTAAEDLKQSVRALLISHGFDPVVSKQAIADFVKAVLAQAQ